MHATNRIKDKNGDTAMDLLLPEDDDIRLLIRKSQASTSISNADIANDDDDDGGCFTIPFANYVLINS